MVEFVFLRNGMKKAVSIVKIENVNRALLGNEFIQYIEYVYFTNAINVLDDKLISFEFNNFKSYYSN